MRQFCQDDAHIFLAENMIAEEITRVIGMVRRVYAALGMEFSEVFLSTRPEKAMGTKEQWDTAEAALRELKTAHPAILAELPARLERVDLEGRGVWHRIQFGEFSGATEARRLCAGLRQQGQECLVVADP